MPAKGFTAVALFLLLIAFAFSANSKEKVLSVGIGPSWPTALWGEDRPTAWNASLSTGITLDRKVSLGASADFLWNQVIEEDVLSQGTSIAQRQQRTFMFPLSAYLSLSPAPDLTVSPIIYTSVGLNTMYYSHEDKSDGDDGDGGINVNGFYMGVIWKVGTEAVMSLSENVSFSARLFYTISKLNKIEKSQGDSKLRRRNMSGFSLMGGLNFYL